MKNLFKTKEPDANKNKVKVGLLSWFLFIAGILFSVLIAYKLAISNIIFDFSNFDFDTLLSLILALFAISLSVAFYFKANDTSNLFYDNTYKFTKEISEILGRIEAGFGERLRHLDEGYSGLSEKINSPAGKQNIKETKAEIEKEKEDLKKEVKARKELIDRLIEQSQLQEDEKKDIKRQLRDREKEIRRKNTEINYLSEKIETNKENVEEIHPVIKRALMRKINELNDPSFVFKYPTSIISKKLTFSEEETEIRELKYLKHYRIIDEDGTLTVHGVKSMKQIAHLMI
ncbi:MAG: hypothetical protein GQ564_01050 [Bacteroidales bacterium]|nr:hypothetical protein [Bacteroidales bacterium]